MYYVNRRLPPCTKDCRLRESWLYLFFFSQETTSSTAFIKEQIYSNGSPMKQTKQLKTKILAITNDMKVNVILAVEWRT